MKRPKLHLCIIFFVLSTQLSAITFSENMQKAVDACIQLRNILGSGSEVGLKAAYEDFIKANISEFDFLTYQRGEIIEMNNHLVFRKSFIEDILNGRNAWRFAKQYADEGSRLGQQHIGRIICQTGIVAANSSITYAMSTHGKIELAIIPEVKGLVSVKIHDITHDKWYYEDKAEKTGLSERTAQLDLPTNEKTDLIIEIINTTSKDFSFACLYGY